MLFWQRCVSAFLLSIKLLSSHSNKPITMVHPMTMVTIVMQQKTSADMHDLFLAFNIVTPVRDKKSQKYIHDTTVI